MSVRIRPLALQSRRFGSVDENSALFLFPALPAARVISAFAAAPGRTRNARAKTGACDGRTAGPYTVDALYSRHDRSNRDVVLRRGVRRSVAALLQTKMNARASDRRFQQKEMCVGLAVCGVGGSPNPDVVGHQPGVAIRRRDITSGPGVSAHRVTSASNSRTAGQQSFQPAGTGLIPGARSCDNLPHPIFKQFNN